MNFKSVLFSAYWCVIVGTLVTQALDADVVEAVIPVKHATIWDRLQHVFLILLALGFFVYMAIKNSWDKRTMTTSSVRCSPQSFIRPPAATLTQVLVESFPPEQQKSVQRLLSLLQSGIDRDYYTAEGQLIMDYTEFDPQAALPEDSDNPVDVTLRKEREERLLQGIHQLLVKANFTPLTQREAEFAFREDYLLTVPVHVQWDQLDGDLLKQMPQTAAGSAHGKKDKNWEHMDKILVYHRGMSLDVTRGQLLWEKIDVLVERVLSFLFKLARLVRKYVLPFLEKAQGRPSSNTASATHEEVEDEVAAVLDITEANSDAPAVELERVRLQSKVLNPAEFMQETTVQEPAFEELFVLWRPKETSDSVRQLRLTGHSANKGVKNLIMIRAVKGVPMADLEIALPEKKLHMKAFDLIQLVISVATAVIALLSQLLKGIRGKTENDSVSSFVIMSAFALFTKTISTYFASMARYNSIVLSGMNARTMAADRCALTFLVNAVRAQEYAEAAAALCVILQLEAEGKENPSEEEVAQKADELLHRADPDRVAHPVPCHLEVPDALDKLKKLGVVQEGTSLKAKGIAGVTKRLEHFLKKQLKDVAEDGSSASEKDF